MHVGALWLWTLLGTWELSWLVERLIPGATTWPAIVGGLVPALVVQLILTASNKIKWPFKKYDALYLRLGLPPISVYVWLWSLLANATRAGDPWPLPYLPILNPLDIVLGFIYLILFKWMQVRKLQSAGSSQMLYGLFAASLFYWLNAILLRTVRCR